MSFSYVQMHGAGNRIVVVDEREHARPPPDVDTLKRLADRDTGLGFDQLMWLLPATRHGAVASYRVFNADGSEVEQCGNGVRCVARLVAADGAGSLRLEGPAGLVEARLIGDDVAVSMGRPEFEPERVPFLAEKASKVYELDVNGREMTVSVLSMGNPHCVLEVDDVTRADVAGLGPLIERHARFPQRCNVGFRHVVDRRTIDLRVFERGVGETPACGTGACAAAVAAMCDDRVDREVAVNLPGGQLMVSWRRPAEPVWLTGNAIRMGEGTIDL